MIEQENLLPTFLRERLAQQYDEPTRARIFAGYAAVRRVSLRANTLRSSAADIAAALARANIAVHGVPFYSDAFVLNDAREDAVRALPEYAQGKLYLQNLSSMLPPLLLAPQAGTDILDMAAAPGGKTTQLAALTGGKAHITACERHANRAARLKFNLAAQGAGNVAVMVQDARQIDDFFAFDQVLLDAPCTGSGTIHFGDDLRSCTAQLLQKCTAQQQGLLQKALRLVKPGHELLYSTCSILRAENEDQIAGVLRSGKAELVPIEPAALPGVPQLPAAIPGTLCVCPTEEYEGFFAAKLRRIK